MKTAILLYFILSIHLLKAQSFSRMDSLFVKLREINDQNYQTLLNTTANYIIENVYANYEKAIENGHTMFEITKKNGSEKAQIYAKIQLAQIYNTLKITQPATNFYKGTLRGKVAYKYLLEAYEQAKAKNYDLEHALAAEHLGAINIGSVRDGVAYKYLLEANNLFKKLNLAERAGLTYHSLAMIQYRNGNLYEAINFFSKVMESNDPVITKTRPYINSFNGIGLIHKKRKEYKKAIDFFIKTTQVAQSLKDTLWVGIAYGNIGDVYGEQKRWDSARKYWAIDIAINKKFNYPQNLVATLNYLADSYWQEGKYTKALETYYESLSYMQEVKGREFLSQYNIVYGLAKTHEQLNHYDSSQKYYKQALAWKDSLSSAETKTQVLQTEFEYVLEQTEQEIKKEQLARKNQLLYALLFSIFLTTGSIILYIFWRRQKKSNKLLQAQNQEIERFSEEVKSQNDYITQQKEELEKLVFELKDRETALQEALEVIREDEKVILEKNDKLALQSELLEEEVKVRTQEVHQKNKELINYTHQLEQFTFIVAHNIRAPIARLQGLINIFNLKKFDSEENRFILQKISESAKELDTIIFDLNEILKIKKGLNRSIESINLPEKLEKIKQILQLQLLESNATILTNWQIESIYSISAYMESILYNLVSNAIKYRSPERPLEIKISTSAAENDIILSIADNGLGIDLKKHGNKLFGLYKRFHLNAEGKGLGLHLVKTQVEALGGRIEVKSEPKVGTEFLLYFKYFA